MFFSPALRIARVFHSALPFGQLRTARLIARFNGKRPLVMRRRIFGHQIELRAERSTTHALVYMQGESFIEDAHVLATHVRPGMTVFDVGGNIGYLTLFFASHVGPSGRVFAFEPEPDNFAELKRNLELNRLANCHAVNVAVGDADGEVLIEAGLNGHVREEGAGTKCELVSIDSFMRRNAIDHVDMVKLDVEGYEMNVLKGMRGLLASPRKPILYVEVHPIGIGLGSANPIAVAEFLAARYSRLIAYVHHRAANPLKRVLRLFQPMHGGLEVPFSSVTARPDLFHHVVCLP